MPCSPHPTFCPALLSTSHPVLLTSLLPCSPLSTLLPALLTPPYPALLSTPTPALSSPLYSQKNMSQATGIFEAISQVLSESPLDFWGANLLSGQDEGSLGWITINYVLDKLVKVLDSTPRG